ncbi:ribonuclease III [Rhizodiscina lignyota]|uniref:Ribonuclease III n=1 Tax=Rhizodiscina lignyota TaxID=1504668 RepID=A0A9P4M580_9PEZI|nr:ribonuclease III [Rhizodiscina lignyota]
MGKKRRHSQLPDHHDSPSESITPSSKKRKPINEREKPYEEAISKSELNIEFPEQSFLGGGSDYVKFPPFSHSKPLNEYVMDDADEQPDLPEIWNKELAKKVFTHKAMRTGEAQTTGDESMTYETLEWLGDRYIELIAVRLIALRFQHLTAHKKSQMKEGLVNNVQLAKYSRAYHLPEKVKHLYYVDNEKVRMKMEADIFEAYVAAVIESDPDHGYSIATKWLTALWAPKVLSLGHAEKRILNIDEAKARLNKYLMHSSAGITIDYVEYRKPKPINNQRYYYTFFRALTVTGWGQDGTVLGRGSGSSAKEAECRAIMNAFDESMPLLEEMYEKKLEFTEKRKKAKEAQAKEDEAKKDEAKLNADT